MIIDHLSAVFPDHFPFAFRIIGRLAFPIYAYLIAEGCRHTRSVPKYLLRLGAFAFISQIPFGLALGYTLSPLWNLGYFKNVFFYETNVFYTFSLAVLSIWIYRKFRGHAKTKAFALPLSIPALAVICFAAEHIEADYGYLGVLCVFLTYVIPEKRFRVASMAAMCCVIYRQFFADSLTRVVQIVSQNTGLLRLSHFNGILLLLFSLISVLLIALYNGERGPDSKTMKWAFYAAYPVHFTLFILIRFFIL
jgi:hypothetical protein